MKTKFQNIWNMLADALSTDSIQKKKKSPHTRGGTDPTVELVSFNGTLQLLFGKRSSIVISSSGSSGDRAVRPSIPGHLQRAGLSDWAAGTKAN